jgi:hypothetical protein
MSTNVRGRTTAHSIIFMFSPPVITHSILYGYKLYCLIMLSLKRTSLQVMPRSILSALIFSVITSTIVAQQANSQPALPAGNAPSNGDTERTSSPSQASEYFIDLKDGAHIPLKLHVRFGLLNMGVSPAGVPFPATGHHHILIDAPLPPFDQPIPSDDNHIHLGAGETEMDLVLTPGPHTLQLLMGDSRHVPHDPPVFSKVIHVVAAEPRMPSVPGAKVYFVSPRDGETLPATSTIRFGVRGMGVAPDSVTLPNTGHHHLIIDSDTPDLDLPIPNDDEHMDFGTGVTETARTLSPGKHTLQLVFGDHNHGNFDPPLQSKRITVTVRPSAEGDR